MLKKATQILTITYERKNKSENGEMVGQMG